MTFFHILTANSHLAIGPARRRLSSTYCRRATLLSLIEQAQQPWVQWQQSVVRLLRAEFTEVLHHIGFDEVDWASWRTFYDEGRTPKAAIDRALERDF